MLDCHFCVLLWCFSFNLATILHSAGQVVEAIPNYERAIQFAPAHANSHYNLATAFEAVGRSTEAAAAQKAAMQLP